jgi:hypothetical protein
VPTDAPFPPAFPLAFVPARPSPGAVVNRGRSGASLVADDAARRAAGSRFEVEADQRERADAHALRVATDARVAERALCGRSSTLGALPRTAPR